MRSAVRRRIQSSVGVKNSLDGRPTPYDKNTIYYAQHAVACCCRKCLEYWHDIPQADPLSEDQIEYFSELCLMYIFERLPDLAENGEKVPPIRKK